jgi:hypothetical protein
MTKQLGRWRSTDQFGASDYIGATPRAGASLRQITDPSRQDLHIWLPAQTAPAARRQRTRDQEPSPRTAGGLPLATMNERQDVNTEVGFEDQNPERNTPDGSSQSSPLPASSTWPPCPPWKPLSTRRPGGPDWMPITPKTGSLFHADSHAGLRYVVIALLVVTFAGLTFLGFQVERLGARVDRLAAKVDGIDATLGVKFDETNAKLDAAAQRLAVELKTTTTEFTDIAKRLAATCAVAPTPPPASLRPAPAPAQPKPAPVQPPRGRP